MGFDFNGVKALLFAKSIGVNFSVTATIGRQQILIDLNSLDNLLNLFKISINKIELNDLLHNDGYAESFLKVLGANEICSIDASSYEGASLIHDMNFSIPNHLKNKFSLVIDGGCLEHIFNFPIAIKNCMEMVQKGGYFIGITPTNNLMGHGFYQFSPELYFRVFSEENGFAIKKVIAFESFPNASWYEVTDPAIIGDRVGILNFRALYLLILAQKLNDTSIFSHPPQQSDYISLWSKNKITFDKIQKNPIIDSFSNINNILKDNIIVKFIRKPIWYLRRFNQPFFKKMDIRNFIENRDL